MHLLLLLAWKLDEVVEERMGEKGRRRKRGMGAERYERFELRCGGIWWESFWFVAFGNFYFLLLFFLFPCFWTIHCQTHTHTQTHSHTHTHSCSRHMETAWKPCRIFREHFQQTASSPLDFFSTSRACLFQIPLYVHPAKLAACVYTPDTRHTHIETQIHSHTSKTHALLCPAHLVDILSALYFSEFLFAIR